MFQPLHAVVTFELAGETLDREAMEDEVLQAMTVTLLYLVVLVASLLALSAVVPERFTLGDVLLEVASAQSTVGVSAGITRPSMSPIAEGVVLVQMWVGRLELIPVFVFARALLFGFDPT